MSVRSVIDIVTHVQNFRNIDLFYQGLYFLKLTIYQLKPKDVKISLFSLKRRMANKKQLILYFLHLSQNQPKESIILKCVYLFNGSYSSLVRKSNNFFKILLKKQNRWKSMHILTISAKTTNLTQLISLKQKDRNSLILSYFVLLESLMPQVPSTRNRSS